jgi:chaperone modulatory protein CbpM
MGAKTPIQPARWNDVMIAFEALLKQIGGLDSGALERWIEARWVLPERAGGTYLFHEVDVARVHLITELTRDLMIDEEALPVVLGLLDQVYRLRKRLSSVARAIDRLPLDLQTSIHEKLKDDS